MARGGEPSTPQTVTAAPDLSKDIEGGQAPVRDPPDEVPVLGFGFCSTKGRRQVNEDRLLFAPRVLGQNRLNFYGVFDGHAGHRASEYCRATMAERLSEALLQRGEDSAALTGDTGVSVLHSVFTQTDAAFLATARAEGWEDGTTACSVLISGTDLFCANAGDSKAIIVRMGATLPLSAIVHRDDSHTVGKALTRKLKELIPRQQFKVPIQAAIGQKIVASSVISPMRKDVLAKCYGGDISRKKKLLQKQAKGKKRMKMMGSVNVPQEAFMAVLNLKDGL